MPHKAKKIWVGLLLVSYLFIFSGAINPGFTAWLMAVPFMILSLKASKKLENTSLLFFSAFLIVFLG